MSSDSESDSEPCAIFDVPPAPALAPAFQVAAAIDRTVKRCTFGKAQLDILVLMIREYCASSNSIDFSNEITQRYIIRFTGILENIRMFVQEYKSSTLFQLMWKITDNDNTISYHVLQLERVCSDPLVGLQGLRNYNQDLEACRLQDRKEMLNRLNRFLVDPSDFHLQNFLTENQIQMADALDKLRAITTRHDAATRDALTKIMAVIHSKLKKSAPLKTWQIRKQDILIRDIVGEGVAGSIHTGEWKGTIVAIKTFDKEISTPAFHRAAHEWTNIHHPNVLELYGASYNEIPCFAVIPYCAQGNVLAFLQRNPRANRMKLAAEVAAGLNYLHSKEIRHCELKGSNVLIDDHLKAKITDFGVAPLKSACSSTTIEQILQPNVRWLSPERLSLGRSDEASDIYMLGVTIWEIFTSRKPWAGKGNSDARQCIVDGKKLKFPPLDFCSTETRQVIRSCWDMESIKRPPSSTVSEYFQSYLSGETLPSHVHLASIPPLASEVDEYSTDSSTSDSASRQLFDLSQQCNKVVAFLEEVGESELAATLQHTFAEKAKFNVSRENQS